MKADLVTRWHGFQECITEKTTVFYVGERVPYVGHDCQQSWDSVVRIGPSPKSTPARHMLTLLKPTHSATPAAYCQHCDVLYLGKDSTNGE